MGLFDFFGKKSGEGAVRKHAERVLKKHTQAAPDRWESIQALSAMGTPEAVEALLARFTIYVDPSITDQEEKDAAFEAIVKTGAVALEPVRTYMRRAETLSWAFKILDRILPADEVVAELIGLLEKMDTEYERDPQRKLQVLAALEERHDARIVDAVRRFLGDVHETARFHAVGAIFAQDGAEAARADLLATLLGEESVRVRSRMLEGFAARGWDVGEHREKLATGAAAAGFTFDPKGLPKRSR